MLLDLIKTEREQWDSLKVVTERQESFICRHYKIVRANEEAVVIPVIIQFRTSHNGSLPIVANRIYQAYAIRGQISLSTLF